MDFKHDAHKLLGIFSRAMGSEIIDYQLNDDGMTIFTHHRISRPDARLIKDIARAYAPHYSSRVNTKKREIIVRPKKVG